MDELKKIPNSTYSGQPQHKRSTSPGGLASLINATRRVMLDVGGTPQDVAVMTAELLKTFRQP